jgi:hypothetical protein
MGSIVPLNFPKSKLELFQQDEIIYVQCIIRKKRIVLTPEEWVRQHVVHFLIQERNFPLSMVVVEKSIRYNGLIKRWDIIAYNNALKPMLLIECKRTTVPIDSSTLHQAAAYQKIVQSEKILLTNGLQIEVIDPSINLEVKNGLEAIPFYTSNSH